MCEEDRDPLDDLGTASCPACGNLMDAAGDVREVAVADAYIVVGSAYWRCPACGLASTS